MIRTVNLLDYLPQFMQDYREMQYIMSAEQPESQALCDTSETIKNNQFITTCNEQGISDYEKMLGITPETGKSLQDRKAYVLAKWIDNIPYTMKVLERKLDALLGAGNHTEDLDNANYTISVTTTLENSSLINALDELLLNILPANLLKNTLYVGNFDIEFVTEFEGYLNEAPQCGRLDCGGRVLPFMM
jgi:hypothetical protein